MQKFLIVGLFVLAFSLMIFAESESELIKRIEKLEAKLYEQKKVRAEDSGNMFSQFQVRFYGHVQGEVIYSDSKMTTATGNYGMWVLIEGAQHRLQTPNATNAFDIIDRDGNIGEINPRNDDDLAITHRSTRFGFDIQAPEVSGMLISGKLEMDFADETSGGENSTPPRIRHAYAKIHWKEYGLSIIAGQTWDLVGMENPCTLNQSPMWMAGNIGFRRPQVRFTKDIMFEESKLSFSIAFTRPFNNSGIDMGLPVLQWRLAFSFKGIAERPALIAFSGHYGRDEHDFEYEERNRGNSALITDLRRDIQYTDSWSFALEWNVPFTNEIVFKGEVWMGKGMGGLLGGVGQSWIQRAGVKIVNEDIFYSSYDAFEVVHAKGLWLGFAFGPFQGWNLNCGFSVDDPDNNDLAVKYVQNTPIDVTDLQNRRTLNMGLYCNILYDITEFLQVGAELSYWHTKYLGEINEDSAAIRFQASMKLTF